MEAERRPLGPFIRRSSAMKKEEDLHLSAEEQPTNLGIFKQLRA